MYHIIRVSLIFIGLMLLIIGTQSCNSDSQTSKKKAQTVKKSLEINTEKEKVKNILFYGNSLTAGFGLKDEESFPSIIQEKIDSLNLNYNIINGGLSGETTSGGKERINWVLKQPIDIFILELGANDMLRGLSLASTRENLDSILTRVILKYPEAIIFIAEMKAAPNMGADYVNGFVKIYSDLAEKHKIEMIPFFLEGVANTPDLLLSDGKHPNAQGQKLVAENIWRSIKGVL